MKILVTGGTGYIGESFIPELIKKGHQVRLLVRDIDKAKKLFGNSCEYFVSDITNESGLKGCCEGVDVVFHMVAKVGNELPTEKNLKIFRSINVQGTKNLVKECKRCNIKKFIYISSIAAMGIVRDNPITEKSICNPYLPYQISKYEAEEYLNNEFLKNSFPVIIVRPTKVYGVGEHEYTYLTHAKLCKKGVFLKIGSGENYTSNIYITDFVQALLSLVDLGKIGETYILSSNNSISFQNIGNIISRVLNKKLTIISIPACIMLFLASFEEKIFILLKIKPIVTKKNIEATIENRVYNIEKAKKDLNFKPLVTMEEGIEKVVKWYIDKGKI